MDKATEMMFDIMHQEHLIICKAILSDDSFIKEMDNAYEKAKKLALKENENAN